MLPRFSATAAAVLCGVASLVSGCATVLTPHDPPLTVITRPDSVLVRDQQGRVVGVAPLYDARLRPSQTLELSRPGWQPQRVPVRREARSTFVLNALIPSALTLAALAAGQDPDDALKLGLLVPLGMAVDVASGRAWDHRPRLLEVTLSEIPAPPPPVDLPLNSARASFAARSLLLRMAQTADEAGCNRIVSETWLDEMDRVAPAAVSSVDSAVIAARAEHHVNRARPRLREMCARSNPLLDSLVAVQSPSAVAETSLGESPYPEAGPIGGEGFFDAAAAREACADAALGYCITFPFGSTGIQPGFGEDVREIAAFIRSFELPVLVLIEGTADSAGSIQSNFQYGLARAVAVRDALMRQGVRPDRLFVASCGEEERCQLMPGAAGGMEGAEFNRRVRLYLQIMEGRP